MSDKPILTPTADILRDDKAILVFAGMIVEMLVNAVPALAPYSALLSLVAFLGFGLLVLHQSIEDLIYAWADAKTTTAAGTSVSFAVGTSVETVKSGTPPVGTTADETVKSGATPSELGAIPADLSAYKPLGPKFQYAGYPPGVVPPSGIIPSGGQGITPGFETTTDSTALQQEATDRAELTAGPTQDVKG